MGSLNKTFFKPKIYKQTPTKLKIKSTYRYREKIQEITQKKGYWDISKKIYLKHGSRKKTVINKRPKKSNNNKQIQYELNLGI